MIRSQKDYRKEKKRRKAAEKRVMYLETRDAERIDSDKRAEAAEKRVVQLEAALREISLWGSSIPPGMSERMYVDTSLTRIREKATAALAGQKPDFWDRDWLENGDSAEVAEARATTLEAKHEAVSTEGVTVTLEQIDDGNYRAVVKDVKQGQRTVVEWELLDETKPNGEPLTLRNYITIPEEVIRNDTAQE